MSSPLPPTKFKFLNELEILDTCDICHDAFSDTHKPTRTECQHIFGHTCLMKWIYSHAEQSNTCPKCRRTLFVKPAHIPIFAQGARPNYPSHFTLDMFVDPKFARVVVLFMWNTMRGLLGGGVIYDSDIDAYIHKVGNYIIKGVPIIFRIEPAHLVSLRAVAKDMIQAHAEGAHSEFVEPNDGRAPYRQIGDAWLPQVAEALGWQFQQPDPDPVLVEHEVKLPDGSIWRFRA